MKQSRYYGLNLVEGGDIVNPLVQDVPNYEQIDEVMHENSVASVPVATELLTGTVHAITRSKPESSMFRFVATSNYNTGDTFTVDGVQVTALMTSGKTLSGGAFVVNSNVLCCLVGTLLTVFTDVGGEVTAYDSERLGGKLPNEYASAGAVTEALTVAQAANENSVRNSNDIGRINTQMASGTFCAYRLHMLENTKVNIELTNSGAFSGILFGRTAGGNAVCIALALNSKNLGEHGAVSVSGNILTCELGVWFEGFLMCDPSYVLNIAYS